MSLTPPPNSSSIGVPKNIGKIGVPQNIGRAQNTDTFLINQKVDRQNAKVSMNQVLSTKAETQGQRSTSITHIGPASTARTSASRYQTNIKTSVNDQQGYDPNAQDEQADENRYNYIQRLARQRKAKQEVLEKLQAKKEEQQSPLSVHTGTSLKKTGVTGFHKQISKFYRQHRTQFGGLSSTQKAILEDTIENKLEHKTTGSSITRYDRLAMKKDINKAKSTGQIRLATAKKFKNIINKLGQ